MWVDHLRYGSSALAELLDAAQVLSHPFVIGELALGQLRRRSQVLGLLRRLPAAPHADHQEVMSLVERQGLAGSGIGWVDAHLLAFRPTGARAALDLRPQLGYGSECDGPGLALVIPVS